MEVVDVMGVVEGFYEERGWEVLDFQAESWAAYGVGKSGLVHAPTGLGKTLAVWMGPVADALSREDVKGCEVLWITPLRALANDTLRSLREPLEFFGSDLEVESRTGDTSANRRAKLRKKLPFCLVTTPESLSLMLTYEDSREKFSGLKVVIVDEWHELLGTKRGVQTELCLARLRSFAKGMRTWGLSATLGNLEEARRVLMGDGFEESVAVGSKLAKEVVIETLIPKEIENFPWSGHLGTRQVNAVVERIFKAESTLLFTNTRSQTEIWYQELLKADPRLEGVLGIHHGSVERGERELVEKGLLEGTLRCVVCTSSLDLGIDFAPVEQVIQVGSPKGIARLKQRAGRSGHQPGKTCRLFCVPSNAFELVEFAAARDALERDEIESRNLLRKPLDVLVQHVFTCAIGERVLEEDFKEEVRGTATYKELSDAEWEWVVGFASDGGQALGRYPQYQKLLREDGGLRMENKRFIQLHRMNIGTIASDVSVMLRFGNGRKLGTVEEWFITKLKKGSQFIFGGKLLEIVSIHYLACTVKLGKKRKKGDIAMWVGSRMPLSTELGNAVARRLAGGMEDCEEMDAVAPILRIQADWSVIPGKEELVVEHTRTREGEHLFLYTFAGRLVNEGLGTIAAYRLSREDPMSIQVTKNDYGFCLSSGDGLPLDEDILRGGLSPENLLEDLLECLNATELAKRQFRGIARVAGLIQQQLPGQRRGTKALQTSSTLLYDVFTRYDEGNLLLDQAKMEVLEGMLEYRRLLETLERLRGISWKLLETEQLTPMAFPLWAERLSATVSSETAASRLEKMLMDLEGAAERRKR